MKTDFFKAECQTKTDKELFGIRDDDNDSCSYLVSEENKNWIAKVENSNKKEITFIAIDNCLNIRDKNDNKQSVCDCMLTFENSIIFIELKEMRKDYIQKAKDQLKNTIRIFQENHDSSIYRKKLAFIANRRHPHFNYSQKESMHDFYNNFKFRLLIQNTIEIKK